MKDESPLVTFSFEFHFLECMYPSFLGLISDEYISQLRWDHDSCPCGFASPLFSQILLKHNVNYKVHQQQ